MRPYPSYVEQLVTKGSFTAVNFEVHPLPDFFNRTYVGRPGVISIADSYFTFRILDMLETPVITNDTDIYPMHRTSLWSQLYGRYHFSFFDQWPWQDTRPIVLWLGRLLLFSALIPTSLLFVGWAIQLRSLFTQKCGFLKGLLQSYEWIFLLQSAGFLCFIVMFTLEYRGFEAMKDIYLLPAFLSFLRAFQLGLDHAYRVSAQSTFWRGLLSSSLCLLVFLYLGNSYLLYESIVKP